MRNLESTAIALCVVALALGIAYACDDSCPVPPPEEARAYRDCAAARTQEECVKFGGSWRPLGIARFPDCLCQTEQEGCPCNSADDCLSECVADRPTSDLFDCTGVTKGACSATNYAVGCRCWFDKNGKPWGQCRD